MTATRITHKQVEAACERYNKALKLHYWRGKKPPSIGYLQWADIRGDGANRRGLYVISNETGGVSSSDLRGKTMRETVRRIDRAIWLNNSQSFCLIIMAVHERGETQELALREMRRRGLWLSAEQKQQAGLLPPDCGQCEGMGETQSASNLEPEPCPVCDGKGTA